MRLKQNQILLSYNLSGRETNQIYKMCLIGSREEKWLIVNVVAVTGVQRRVILQIFNFFLLLGCQRVSLSFAINGGHSTGSCKKSNSTDEAEERGFHLDNLSVNQRNGVLFLREKYVHFIRVFQCIILCAMHKTLQ